MIRLLRDFGFLVKREALELIAEILPPPARKAEPREEAGLVAPDRVFR